MTRKCVFRLAALFLILALAARAGEAPAEEEVNRIVDAAVAGLAAKDAKASPGGELAGLKGAAVQRLLFHLRDAEPKRRMAALRGLAVCWDSAARRPAIDALGDKDQEVRNRAADLVREKVSPRQLCELLPKLLEDKNLAVAVPVFELAEQHAPDLSRMKQVIEIPEFHKVMERYLPRYYSPELTPATRRLLDGAEPSARRAAVIALIHQNDAAAETRARIAGLLADPDADLREVAAEYLLWHGTQAELPALDRAAAGEKDPQALAAVRAARELAVRRAKARLALGLDLGAAGGQPPPAAADYREAFLAMRVQPGAETRGGALDLLRSKEPFEPLLRYAGAPAETEAARRRPARLRLAAELFCFPGRTDLPDGERPAGAPLAGFFAPPVRDYFDPRRQSYGLLTGNDGKTFDNSAHVGDDVAWLKDQRTVTAVADGVVRRVRCSYTWGHIAIVEHAMPDDEWCCSLYAHLSPAICVRPGDIVKQGQKIGSTGRSLTWENGGYWSHLHFGIHEGPFSDGDWICGYVSTDRWKSGNHGWVDPQAYLKKRMEPESVPAKPDPKPSAA